MSGPSRPPAIDRLLRAAPELPRSLALREARALTASVRDGAPAPEDWVEALRDRVKQASKAHLQRVINATGVVLHTNLGRAPLSESAIAAVTTIGPGYSNLELELGSGKRGERLSGVLGALTTLTGAASAVAVNNNAAAVLLMLTAIAAGREVIVSRGELVEIGGAFRIPEVIAAGGARLREVGATNRTRLSDYAAAIGPDTAAILLVHPSNFRIVGFTGRPSRAELVALAKERGVLLLEDLGSGALVEGLGEPTVTEAVKDGADLVCFSGDKLLGGPQAGLVAGRADLIQKLRKHPLYRALRLDRLVLAALEATLRGYLAGELPPAVQMIQAEPAVLRRRAEAWRVALGELPGFQTRVCRGEAVVGGGASPEIPLPGWLLGISVVQGPDRVSSADKLISALRTADPPVIARIVQDEVCLDPRTVLPEEEASLLAAIRAAVRVGDRSQSHI